MLLIVLSVKVSRGDADLQSETLAPYVYLAEADHPKTALFAREETLRAAPNSTTKIMTCILALEHCELDALVSVPPEALGLSKGMTQMGFTKGDRYTVHELLYGLMLISGNDASIALAVHISGSVKKFAALMNEKATQLGMDDTHFVNSHGLYHEGHYSTARDMAQLTAYALQNSDFCRIVGTAVHEIPATRTHGKAFRLINYNKLVSASADSPLYYPYAIGVKTGSTPRGGMALVSAAKKDGVTLICVMMGLMGEDGDANTRSNRRFTDSITLFEYGFARLMVLATPSPSPKPSKWTAVRSAAPTIVTVKEAATQSNRKDRYRPAAQFLLIVAIVALGSALFMRKRK